MQGKYALAHLSSSGQASQFLDLFGPLQVTFGST